MATKFEEVKYIFTGDSSSLSNSTKEAINVLDQYEAKIAENMQKVSAAFRNATKTSTETKQKLGSLNATKFDKINQQINTIIADFKRMTSTSNEAKAKLGSLNATKFDGARQQLSSLASSVASKIGSVSNSIASLISKMSSIKSKATSALSNLATPLRTISSAFRRVAKESDTWSAAQSRLSGIVRGSSKLFNNLKTALNGAATSMQSLSQHTAKTSSSFRDLVSTGVGARSLFNFLTGMQLGTVLTDGIQSAIHYTEVLNMFNVVLGESVEAGNEYIAKMQEMYGLDPTTIMEAASVFYQLSDAINAPAEASQNIALGLTTVTTDLASLFDMDFNKVAQDLASGMQGMTRAVRKYGIDIRMATLEATAANLGLTIDASTTSEANRQALRYITIVQQARNATGDFAKTIESPANQLRILKEQFLQLARSIGNFFIPVLSKILPYLNGIVMAIRSILQFFAKLFHIELPSFGGATSAASQLEQSTGGASDNIGDAAKKAKKLKKELTAGIDELNILNEDKNASASGGAGGGGVSSGDLLDPTLLRALEDMQVELDEVRMKANDVRDAILSFLGFSWDKNGELTFDASQLEQNLIDKFPSWTNTIKAVFANWQGIVDGVKNVWEALLGALKAVFAGIAAGFKSMIQAFNVDETVAGWIEELPDKLQAIADWINNNSALFYGFGNILSVVMTAFAGWQIVTTLLRPLQTLVTIITTLGPAMSLAVVAAAALAIGFRVAWEKSETFRTAVGQLKDSFKDMCSALADNWKALWDVLEPILSQFAEGFGGLWSDTLAPFLVNVVNLCVDIISAFTNIVTFILKTFGPDLEKAFNAVGTIVGTAIELIIKIINGIVETCDGIVDFINDVFKGDWKDAWEAVKKAFKTPLQGIINVATGMVNGIISVINYMLNKIVGGVNNLINSAKAAISELAELAGIKWSPKYMSSVPQIPKLSAPQLATGGVVKSPTLSWIGEGSYPEAVIPLNNSPQMLDLLNKFADIVENQNKTSDDTVPLQVVMNLDGEVIYKNQQKVSRKRGVTFDMGAFER